MRKFFRGKRIFGNKNIVGVDGSVTTANAALARQIMSQDVATVADTTLVKGDLLSKLVPRQDLVIANTGFNPVRALSINRKGIVNQTGLLDSGLGEFYKFTLDGSQLTEHINLALFTGHFNVFGIKNNLNVDFTGQTATLTSALMRMDIHELRRYGIIADAVLEEGTFPIKKFKSGSSTPVSVGSLTMYPGNDKYSLWNFLDSIKNNRLKVIGMQMNGVGMEKYSGEMELGITNAFNSQVTQRINMAAANNPFQNQDGSMILGVNQNFEINANTYLIFTLYAGMKIDFTFTVESIPN
jgi:hypothetical protein